MESHLKSTRGAGSNGYRSWFHFQDSMFNNGKSPTKMFEYMAMKCAVIASDVGEAAHIIENGANGLKAQEIKDLRLCQATRG